MFIFDARTANRGRTESKFLVRFAVSNLPMLAATALISLLALFASPVAQAQSVNIAFNSVGLSSLAYNGTQFLSYGDLRLDQIELLINPDGSITIGSTSSSVTVDSVRTDADAYLLVGNNHDQKLRGFWESPEPDR